MKVFDDLAAPEIATPTVVTLGVFDGLHLGHQEIIRTVVDRARALEVAATVITFEPHPRAVLHPETAPPLLRTLQQKLEGLDYLGVDQVIILRFDAALAAVTAGDFIRRFIYERLQAREVYLGRGFAFGYKREGNIELLKKCGAELGFYAGEVGEVQLKHHRVSSTLIRRLLRAGRVNLARRMLGRPYGVEGEIVEGRKVGRTIDFPTANLQAENAVIPADGVYVTLMLIDGVWRRGVTNIGLRPTFAGESARTVETFLIDFNDDLYGRRVRLRFLHRLRGERKFADVNALKAQINADLERANRYFNSGAARKCLDFK